MDHTRITPGLAVVLLAVSCSGSGGSGADKKGATTTEPDTVAPVTLATVPPSQRVDLEPPTFSHPTTVDNPLFPISNQRSAVYLGNDEGSTLKVEVTLLPETRTIEVDGTRTEVVISQFVSFIGGRVSEVTFDWYAQDDTGAVWFFGEDVTRYEDGVVLDHEGSWQAGEDGAKPAMMMPAQPRVGDVFRTEDVPDAIVEEVVVKELGVTVPGPRGPVPGAMVGQELHILEGLAEDKTFAPRYGEFISGIGSNTEVMALDLPVDARQGPPPAELTAIVDGAAADLEAADTANWAGIASAGDAVEAAWARYKAAGDVPPLLAIQMDRAVRSLTGDALSPAEADRNVEGVREGAIRVAQAGLDLQLQYRPPAGIDLDRLEWWARQLVVDSSSAEPDPGRIAGDVATMELIWQRLGATGRAPGADAAKAQLDALRHAADTEDVMFARRAAPRLVEAIAAVTRPA